MKEGDRVSVWVSRWPDGQERVKGRISKTHAWGGYIEVVLDLEGEFSYTIERMAKDLTLLDPLEELAELGQ